MTISNEVKEYLRDIQSHLLALLFLKVTLKNVIFLLLKNIEICSTYLVEANGDFLVKRRLRRVAVVSCGRILLLFAMHDENKRVCHVEQRSVSTSALSEMAH